MTFKTVKLKSPWMDHPKGSVLTIRSEKADELVSRKSAVIKEEKMADGPPVNKMVDEPKRRKSKTKTP